MSLQSILSKIVSGIKRLFTGLPAELKVAVHTGVSVVDNLRVIMNSPVIDVLTAIIPGDVDDLIKAKLRQALPVLLQGLKLADATMSLSDPDAIMKAALADLKAIDPAISQAMYHSLSILVAQVAADGKLSWTDGVYLLEWYYKTNFKTAA